MTIEDEDDEAAGDESVSDWAKQRVDGCSGWKSGADKMRF